jgi:tRNA 2-thiouridine synthesizing protein C
MKKKSFLFIFKQAPHLNLNAKEGMDFAFSCAAFEQQVDALFVEDGVYQLVKNQDTNEAERKNHSLGIEAFSLYGISHCYVHEKSLNSRKLEKSDLIKDCELSSDNFTQQLNSYDYIFSY